MSSAIGVGGEDRGALELQSARVGGGMEKQSAGAGGVDCGTRD